MKKAIEKGTWVVALDGKHKGEKGIVVDSDKSITTVMFGNSSDPVWTINLQII